MLTKSFAASIFLLAFASSVHAHAGVHPALGVAGGGLQRSDVQRPSKQKPCGAVDIAKNLDSSTAIPANADGTVSAVVTDFNPGADGSRSIKTAEVDSSGTGQNFDGQATVLTNGDPNPTSDASQNITVKLPDGTKCAGGTNKNLCLVSFTTTAGFGNCVVVSQGAGAAKRDSSVDTEKPIRNGAAKGVRPSDKKATQDKSSEKDKSNGKQLKSQGKQDKSQGKKDKSHGKQDGSKGQQDKSKGKQLESQGKQDKSQGKKNKSQGKKNKSQGKKNKSQGKKNKSQGKKAKSQGKASGSDKSQSDSARRMTPERRYRPFRNGAAKGVPRASDEARQFNPAARRMTPRRHWSSRKDGSQA